MSSTCVAVLLWPSQRRKHHVPPELPARAACGARCAVPALTVPSVAHAARTCPRCALAASVCATHGVRSVRAACAARASAARAARNARPWRPLKSRCALAASATQSHTKTRWGLARVGRLESLDWGMVTVQQISAFAWPQRPSGRMAMGVLCGGDGHGPAATVGRLRLATASCTPVHGPAQPI